MHAYTYRHFIYTYIHTCMHIHIGILYIHIYTYIHTRMHACTYTPDTHTHIGHWQWLVKRPAAIAKEAYFYGKRDLLLGQKRPTSMAKETYFCGKRDLLL